MSDALIIGLSTVFASILSTIAIFFVSQWVNSRKLPVEIKQMSADTSLTKGDLAEKYQGIANRQADENIELTKQNMELKKQIEANRDEMMLIINENKKELEKIRKTLDEEIIRGRNFEDWARRLVLQLQSWRIEPVPFDVNMIKEEMKKNCTEG
jgi:hypothetical protein